MKWASREQSSREQAVPDVLLRGHHAEVAAWRRQQALRRTLAWRPDLLDDPAWAEAENLGLVPPADDRLAP